MRTAPRRPLQPTVFSGDRRRDRRRRASRGVRLVVASRDRRAPPPLGGDHRRGGAAHSLARLGRAPSADQPAGSSLFFTGVLCAFMAAAVTWWLRDESSLVELIAAALATAPLAAFWLWASSPPSAPGPPGGRCYRCDPRRDRLSGVPRTDRRVPNYRSSKSTTLRRTSAP